MGHRGGPLYFANAGNAHSRLLELVDSSADRPRTLILDLVGVPDVDVTTLLRLEELEQDLAERGTALRFENVAARVIELAPRTPGLADRFAKKQLLERRQSEGKANDYEHGQLRLGGMT